MSELEERIKYIEEKLNEASLIYEAASIKTESLESDINIALIHLIKYDVIKYRQDTSWIASINKLLGDVKNPNVIKRNQYNEINKNFDRYYEEARIDTLHELINKGYDKASTISPIEKPEIYSFEFLLDKNKIYGYLYKHAYSHEVRDYFSIKSKLSKSDEEIMKPKYSIIEAFPGVKINRMRLKKNK